MGHNVPEPKKGEDDYDRIKIINQRDNRYAGLLDNVVESDNYLLFTYGHNGFMYLACYDKRKKKTDTFAFQTSSASVKATIFVT